MKYLVLGSEGQIGNVLVKYLQVQGHLVSTWDIAANPWEDLRINNRVDEEMKKVDFVFFLAFDIGGAKYLKNNQDKFEFIDNNIQLMTSTFNSLRRCKKPFIFVSSEMANLRFSTYGTLKAVGECYVRSLNSIVTKLWNTYGIEIHGSTLKSHAITDFIHMAKRDKRIKLKTNGKEERQLLYAKDCAECLYILSQKYDEIDRNKEINIASFKWTSMLDVANIVSNLLGNVPVITSDEVDMTHKNMKVEPDQYVLDFWKPTTSLEDGISHIINSEAKTI